VSRGWERHETWIVSDVRYGQKHKSPLRIPERAEILVSKF